VTVSSAAEAYIKAKDLAAEFTSLGRILSCAIVRGYDPRCISVWHCVHSVMRFNAESSPDRLRKLLVVNFEVQHRSTRLTPPTIATQNALP
jgi:hypothetical protein